MLACSGKEARGGNTRRRTVSLFVVLGQGRLEHADKLRGRSQEECLMIWKRHVKVNEEEPQFGAIQDHMGPWMELRKGRRWAWVFFSGTFWEGS